MRSSLARTAASPPRREKLSIDLELEPVKFLVPYQRKTTRSCASVVSDVLEEPACGEMVCPALACANHIGVRVIIRNLKRNLRRLAIEEKSKSMPWKPLLNHVDRCSVEEDAMS